MKFTPRCLPTGSGGLPHTDVKEVCQIILDNFPEIPYLPFTIKGSPWDSAPSYRLAEGMPCVVADEEKRRIYFDTSDPDRVEDEMVTFYDRYLAHDVDYFAISPERNEPMLVMLDMLQRGSTQPAVLRYSLTGPVTFGLRVNDERGKPIFYNEAIRDAFIKALAMKAKWQEREIQKALPGVRMMAGLAEPMLQAYSSAYASIARAAIVNGINEVISGTSDLSWIHCCANIDWPILLDTNADVIHFDAYEYASNLALYSREVKDFLDRGGALGWGIVPTTNEKISGECTDSLAKKLEQGMQLMVDKGIDRRLLLDTAYIAPSCATTTMSPHLALEAYRLTREIADSLRMKYSLVN